MNSEDLFLQRALNICEKSALPVEAIELRIPQPWTKEEVALCNVLFDMVLITDAGKRKFREFLCPEEKEAQDVSKNRRFVIPCVVPRDLTTVNFSVTTEDSRWCTALLMGSLKWGINVPTDHCRKFIIKGVTLGSEFVACALSEGGSDYVVRPPTQEWTDARALIHRTPVAPVLLVLQRRYLDLHYDAGTAVEDVRKLYSHRFVTECLWYPPFGNKRVVKYLRSALQGAMGQITNPLRLAELLVRCEVGAPRLREVLFLKEDVTKES